MCTNQNSDPDPSFFRGSVTGCRYNISFFIIYVSKTISCYWKEVQYGEVVSYTFINNVQVVAVTVVSC